MVRTRGKNKTPKNTITIVLSAKTESLWKDLKEKFKFKGDDDFISFLLVLAQNEYSWCRRKRMGLIKEKNIMDEEEIISRQPEIAALRHRHIASKNSLQRRETNSEPESEEVSAQPEMIKPLPKRHQSKNLRKCLLCKSAHKQECGALVEGFMKSESNEEQIVQAGLVTKITSKKGLFDNSLEQKGNNMEDLILESPLTSVGCIGNNITEQKIDNYPMMELYNHGHVLKPEEIRLKVSEMAESRFEEDELEDGLLEPSILQGGDVSSFDDKLENLKLTFGKQNDIEIAKELYGPRQLKSTESLILSQLSSSAENTQENVTGKCLPGRQLYPDSSPAKNDAEKENLGIHDGVVMDLGGKENTSLEKLSDEKSHGNNVAEEVAYRKDESQVSLGGHRNRCEAVEEVEATKCGEAEDIWEPTLPPEFSLRVADPMHGPSVFTNALLSVGHDLGPLLGVIIREMDIPDDSNMHDIWQVGTDDEPLYLSTRESEHSDWLRHVRPAPNQMAANCVTTVINCHLYFRITREVPPDSELLYWTDDVDSKWAKKRLDKTSCGGCNLQLGHTLYYKTHCKLFHDPTCSLNIRKYYCKVCGVPVLGKDKIITHAVEAHQGKGAYQCQFCRKFFLRLRHLELHRNYGCANNPNRSRVKCDLCDREFSQPQKLKTHKRRMHNDLDVVLKEFQCCHCKKILGSGAGLLRHKKEVHNKDLAAATCDRCGKVFQNKSNLKIHMLTHSGVKPFRCQEADCTAGFTTKQRLQAHYKNTHGLNKDAIPEIQRSVAFTFDAYCGEKNLGGDESPSSPLPLDEDQSEGMSPLSVGCSADLPPLSMPRPDEFSDEKGEDESEGGSNGLMGCPTVEVSNSLPSKGSRKWVGSPALYRIDNYSASLLVEEAICAAEKDIIEKDVMDGVLPYDALPHYISSPPLQEQREVLPRDYSANSPPSEAHRDVLRSHLYPSASPPLEEHHMLRAHLYNPASPPLEEAREMLRTHILQRNYTPPLGFKMNSMMTREYSPTLDEPRDCLKTNSLLRDYNISSLIREDLQEGDPDGRGRGLIDPGKDPEVSEYRSNLCRDESRDGLTEFRRPESYRRDGYDAGYPAEGEAQNLSLKEKSLHLDLSYKAYEGLEELERIGRDPAGLDTLLVGDQGGQTLSRSLHLSPRYPPTYDTESMDLSLPRLPYPSSPIYSLDLPGRFDIPSGRLVDLRSHLGLSPHRFPSARVVGGNGSPPSGSYIYQPTFAAPSTRHSPTPSYHPYSAYY